MITGTLDPGAAAPLPPAVPPAIAAPASATVRLAVAAGGLWAAAYTVVCLAGEKFSTFYLGIAWQLVPYEILRADPIRSVWYLHIQPPLWNLAIGVIGRWSPLPDAISLQLLQATFGVLAAALLAVVLRRLSCRPWLALTLALLATLNPEFMRNAFEPTYEMPVAFLLVALVWALTWDRPGREFRSLMGVASFATLVILTRSLYHPVWALAIVALVAWAYRDALPWKRIGVAFLVPLVLAGGWMLKNEVMFGRATMSSWFGMNLQRGVIPVLPLAEKQQMFDEGKISGVAMIGPFGNYDLYRPVMPPCTPEHTHPALTKELRDNPVVIPNLNYECFLPVYDQAGKDAIAVIKAYPGVWLKGREWSARVWFATNQGPDSSPSWPYRQLSKVYRAIRLDVPGKLSTTDWGTPIYGPLSVDTRFSLTMVNLTLFAFAYGHLSAWSIVRRRRDAAFRGGNRTRTLVLAVVGATALWTFVIGVVGELGEQARFRTMTDPLVLAIGIAEVLRWLAPKLPHRVSDYLFDATGVPEPTQESEPEPEPWVQVSS